MSPPSSSQPSTYMRRTLPVICLSLIASAALAAEQPAGTRNPGALSEAAVAAEPAVDTSKTSMIRSSIGEEGSSAGDEETSTQPATPASSMARRAAGPQAVVRNDRLELDTTVVTGNRELPKVLYIVPWKKSDLGELPAQPFNTLLDEALTPVDRDVFRREVTYYGALAGGGGGGADGAPSSAERTEK